MSTGLIAYAVKFLEDPDAVRREVNTPVLLWERAESREQAVWTTLPGKSLPHLPHPGDSLVLRVSKGNIKGNGFGLGVTVGRTENNDIALPDNSVSRFHAYFQQDPRSGQWKLVDAESRNGTWVESTRLAPNGSVLLPAQALLRFGQVEVQFLSPEEFLSYIQHCAVP